MLVLRRHENESWLNCAVRHAKPYALEAEVITEYNYWIKQGKTSNEAAYFACEEWDLLAYEERL